jgi:hypothetical protein
MAGVFACMLVGSACGDNEPTTPAWSADAAIERSDVRSDGLEDPGTGDDSAPQGDLLVLPAEFLAENAPLKMLEDGDSIQLTTPPQGGHIAMISAKVKNLPGIAMLLHVQIRRMDGAFIVAEEQRTVAMLDVPGEPGFKQPNLASTSQASQVPICPEYGATEVLDREVLVQVEITALDVDPRVKAIGGRKVVPRCSQVDPAALALCRCECAANYYLGKCGPGTGSDAGLDALGQ